MRFNILVSYACKKFYLSLKVQFCRFYKVFYKLRTCVQVISFDRFLYFYNDIEYLSMISINFLCADVKARQPFKFFDLHTPSSK